jgi:N6-adenosine-specific RNA methylase IME4
MQGGLILDGRNRYRACVEISIEPRFETFTGDDPLGHVISANLHRRHLNASQRAMIAERLETMKQGRPGKDANLQVFRDDAAATLRVSARSIADAKKVREQASPAIVARVESGEIAVSVAAKVAALPKAEQKKLAGESEAVLRGAGKKAARDKRESALAAETERASAELGTKLYSVIYADPPWRFEPYSRDSGMDRAADNHYPTLTLDAIRQISPPAAKDCALFLWATAPMLPEALSVIAAWGFTYKSHFIWHKNHIGTGYWARNQHELLLIATRGSVPAPAPGQQYPSVISADAAEHSRKPDAFAEMIAKMFPNARPLEMFARKARAGWDAWGNEATSSGARAA